MDSQNSAWCLAVDLCICFHLLLNESSMTVRVFTNLITRECSPRDQRGLFTPGH
ncbi:hypothetical protein STEG23_017817, partial [Scotinomys teguina]